MKKLLLMILVLALLAININCGGGGGSGGSAGTSLVTITVGDSMQTASLKVEKNTLFAQAKIFVRNLIESDFAVAAIRQGVDKIVFTIAASDMATITKEVLVAGQTSITETFSVPNGNDRYFLVEAKDSSGTVLYRGSTTADLDGTPITLSINMVALDITPPTVISTSPADKATGVSITSAITITFSKTIDSSTFNSTTFTLKDSSNNPISGTVTYSGTTATFTPSSNLAYNTTFTATITTGVKDLVGNAMAANYSWTFTTVGYALQFDGVDDYISIPDTKGDFDFKSAFTVEAWVRPLSLAGSGLFKAIVSGDFSEPPFTGGGWVMFLDRSDYSNWGLSVCVPLCDAASSGAGNLQIDQWQHLAAKYDGSNIVIYRNGVMIASTPKSGNVSAINVVLIGIWETSFNGKIDEVRIWNIARTQAEIQANMNKTLSGTEPGLVGYWRFDEGMGTATIDNSGNGNTGTLKNGPAVWIISTAPIIQP
jgi:hypothetical protein